jgi:hypothetical protein
MSTTRPRRDVRISEPYGCRVVHVRIMRTGGLPPRACGVAAGVELDPEVRLADPQPRDLENPDVALEALRLDGAEGGLVEIPRPAGVGQ